MVNLAYLVVFYILDKNCYNILLQAKNLHAFLLQGKFVRSCLDDNWLPGIILSPTLRILD